MPYAAHTLVTIGGTLLEAAGQPNEIWQIGVRVDGVQGQEQAYLDALADDTSTGGTITQWWLTSANCLSNSAVLNYVKVAAVLPNQQLPALTHNFTTPHRGPNEAQLPNFVSMAITLEGANPKAPGNRGRVYPPNTVPFSGSSTDTSQPQKIAASGVSLVDALSGGGTLGAIPVIASKKYGTLVPIVACSADCILDTQRRRRNQLLEFRQTETV